MKTLPAGRQESQATTLAELTTIGVGGSFDTLVWAESEEAVITAVREADEAQTPVLALGGGSNILASDDHFPGVIVRDARSEVAVRGGESRESSDIPTGVTSGPSVLVTATAGYGWDEFVACTVAEGWAGLEALSGIPGTVGAAPVQNIGAYGHDVSECLVSIRAYDRASGTIMDIPAHELSFGYRTSALKQSAVPPFFPSPRWIVLAATFRLAVSSRSAPVAYAQLAELLGTQAGESAPIADVRDAVLALRASKGMVLDDSDRDTYSCGSFFTNPVLTEDEAASLPDDAPRFAASATNALGAAVPEAGMVKTSAAWLIDHAGFPAGYAVPGPAALSTKHCLALTNRGGASGQQMRALAEEIIEGVQVRCGVRLVPEPILL